MRLIQRSSSIDHRIRPNIVRWNTGSNHNPALVAGESAELFGHLHNEGWEQINCNGTGLPEYFFHNYHCKQYAVFSDSTRHYLSLWRQLK
jgi:hypothetical protein